MYNNRGDLAGPPLRASKRPYPIARIRARPQRARCRLQLKRPKALRRHEDNYWERMTALRLSRAPTGTSFVQFRQLKAVRRGTLISYVSRNGAVRTVLTFNASRQIASLSYGLRRIVQNKARHELRAKPRALGQLGRQAALKHYRSTMLRNACLALFRFPRSVE